MTRRLRIDPSGAFHHVMNRGTDHQRVFFDDADRHEFIRLLGEIHERFGVETVAYCLMDNHFHLVLHCVDGQLSKAMQHLAATYTRHTNDRVQRDGPLFRGRFRSIHITTDPYLLCAVRYVHRNALDIVGVSHPSAYRWSSHRDYLGQRRNRVWLDITTVGARFAGPLAFDDFVTGDQVFHRPTEVGGEDLRAFVSLGLGDVVEEAQTSSDRGLDRSVLHLLNDVGALDGYEKLRAELPSRGTQAHRSAMMRARRRAEARPEVMAIVEQTLRLLNPHRPAA